MRAPHHILISTFNALWFAAALNVLYAFSISLNAKSILVIRCQFFGTLTSTLGGRLVDMWGLPCVMRDEGPIFPV